MTENTNNFNLESFPGSKSHRLSWPTARRNYIAKAMIAHNNGTDNTGLLYYLLEHEEFSNLAFKIHPNYDEEGDERESGSSREFNTFSPCKRPNWDNFFITDTEGNRTHDGATYKHKYEIWDRQEITLQKFTANFLDSLDEVALGAIGPADQRMIMPLRDMFHALDTRFGFITTGELRKERAKLRIPTTTLSKFDSLLETHASIHLLLEDNDIPTSDNEKIFTLQDALVNFPQLSTPTSNFELEHRLKSKGRSYDRFTSYLTEYINSNGLSDAAPTDTPHAYAGHVKRNREENEETDTKLQTPSTHDISEDLVTKIVKRLNSINKNTGKKPTGEPRRAKKSTDAPQEYCYIHGLGNHNGEECRNFTADEKFKAATKANHMGGSDKVWKNRK
jgi:hypothetical protein